MGYWIGLMGLWILQDALASIVFYPQEKWIWNHTARFIRVLIGIGLICMGFYLL